MHKSQIISGTALFAMLVIGAQGAVVFHDDFSSGAASDDNWVKSPGEMNISYSGGVCKIVNDDPIYDYILEKVLKIDPAIFTISCKVTKITGAGPCGFYFCMKKTDDFQGYYIQISQGNTISVQKNSTIIFNKECLYINSEQNEIKVSKNGSTFNVFCNGYSVGTFNDNTFSTDTFALHFPPKQTMIFDDVTVTNEFETLKYLDKFVDDFQSSSLKPGWGRFGSAGSSYKVEDSVLKVSTPAKVNSYFYTNIPIINFIAKVTTSHQSGNKRTPYGLILKGTASDTIPIACFSINANNSYATYGPRDNSIMFSDPSSQIHGAAYIDENSGVKTYKFDTLEIIKRQSSQEYIFVVNKDTLKRFTGVNFPITGVGFFCSDSSDVNFDNFAVAEGTEYPQKIRIKPKIRVRFRGNTPGRAIYNPLGRMVIRDIAFYDKKTLPAGLYLQKGINRAVLITKP